jgi:hypothetical protein
MRTVDIVMNKYVFLDIDDVLLPWDFKLIQEIIDHSGYVNWKKVNHTYMKQFSFDLMNDVNDSLGEHIYWLTTWELHGEGANALFNKKLGFPPYKEIPFIGEYYEALGNGMWMPKAGNTWWKSSMLKRFVDELEGDYKIVWIDNEIDEQVERGYVSPGLTMDENILMISPYPCLTKAQVQEAKDWLES